MLKNEWTIEQLAEIKEMDAQVADLIKKYHDNSFIPTWNNILEHKEEIQKNLVMVQNMEDPFWKSHLTACLESHEYGIELDCLVPYNFIGNPSNRLQTLAKADARSTEQRAIEILEIMQKLPPTIDALFEMLEHSSPLGKSMIAQTLKTFFKNINYAVEVAEACENAELKSEILELSKIIIQKAKKLDSTVEYTPLIELPTLPMEFEYAAKKGMQVDPEDILSWVDEDVEFRKNEFFRMAKEIDPSRDPYDLMKNGSVKYDDVETMFKDTRNLINGIREAALQFIDLPEGEKVELGETPEAWWPFCPTAMYGGVPKHIQPLTGRLFLNTNNLIGFTRANIEETIAHELYPGHHSHSVISQTLHLGKSFQLGSLWMNRALSEGLCHRSEFMMIPYYSDPISKLEAARRGWYCATRVKAEILLYKEKKAPKDLVENYMKNLMTTEYAATAQTQAHMMRPADGVSYYTGMRFLENLYKQSGKTLKEFTNEIFSYGEMSLHTMAMLLQLPAEKKRQLQQLTLS